MRDALWKHGAHEQTLPALGRRPRERHCRGAHRRVRREAALYAGDTFRAYRAVKAEEGPCGPEKWACRFPGPAASPTAAELTGAMAEGNPTKTHRLVGIRRQVLRSGDARRVG